MFNFIRETPITISITAVALIAFLIPPVAGLLELDTTANLLLQIPQVLGCHVLHWSFEHLSWDLFMFVLIGTLCERRSQLDYAVVLLLSSILIPFFVAAYVPSVSTYRGLSGIDTALFSFAALLLVDESWREKNWQAVWIYGILFVGMLGKTGYELAFGGTLFVNSDAFSPVPIAHIVGAAIGSLVAGMRKFRKREQPQQRKIMCFGNTNETGIVPRAGHPQRCKLESAQKNSVAASDG